MSNLIKRDQYALFEIESFNVEEIEENLDGGRGGPFIDDDPYGEFQGVEGDEARKGNRARENFQARLARLEKEAYEKGFEQGQKDGLTLGEKRVEERVRQLEALFSEIGGLKEQIYFEAEQDLIRLSMTIAEKVLKAELKTDPKAIVRTVRRALDLLANKSCIKILVSPDDMTEMKKLLPSLKSSDKIEKCQLVEDEGIGKGGCVLETDFGRINATIQDGLAALEKELEKELHSHQGEPGGDGP